MANTMQIRCISRTERMSPPERITHVGGYESSQWKMTLDDAIAKIESGEQAFFVQAHRRTVGVIVAVSPSGKKYLKAEADGDQPDSLLRLPGMPRVILVLSAALASPRTNRATPRLHQAGAPRVRSGVGKIKGRGAATFQNLWRHAPPHDSFHTPAPLRSRFRFWWRWFRFRWRFGF